MEQFKSAHSIAHILLSNYNRKDIDSELINNIVDKVFLHDFTKVDKNELIAALESDFEIHSKEATMLVAEDVKPWLYDKKSKIDFELWERYKMYMNQKDASFPLDTLDDITDKILDKCVDPKTKGRWDRRGMVVGNVQSGKTANYTGLINKATGAGYKLIIVIAGIHNSLRAQTQIRLDEGFIGRSSSAYIFKRLKNKIGVGNINAKTEIYSFTSSDAKGDFNRRVATSLNVPIKGLSPTVLVIKKNKSILENLILWLYQFTSDSGKGEMKIFDVPLLLIDDEADNASVNSGTELDVRTINRLIRTLLNLFNQNTFIGYTATPYANIFIPSSWSEKLETMVKDVKLKVGEDLFPRDFIINIPPPSNYIGAVQIFGFENEETGEEYEGLEVIRYVEDQEPLFPKKINKYNKEDLPEDVPTSLKTAIKSFILTCAIRRLRGQETKHNSMLVHVALYVAWIDKIAWLVNEIMRDYKRQIRSGQGPLLSEIEELFENDFIPTTDNVLDNISYKDPKIKQHTWEEVKSVLNDAVSKIEVRAVHGTKNTRFLEYHKIEDINYDDYDNGMSVIAVGGNRLARGITLEGLSVSYYLRATRLYDSLMQMGRWFGYRPGYVDLCRLYTTEQLFTWFRHITLASEEMKVDFDVMASQNLKPKDYQLKIRTHPGLLNITASSKMREHEKIQVGLSGDILQTYQLIKKKDVIINNLNAFINLLIRLDNTEKRLTKSGKINGLIWRNITSDKIIDFISQYQSDLPKIRPEIIKSYISKQNDKGLLKEWEIAVIINSETEQIYTFKTKDEEIKGGLPLRNSVPPDSKFYFTLSKNNIFDKRDRRIGLDINDKTLKEKDVKALRAKEGKSLLVIYPLDWSVDNTLPQGIPLIGWGLIFPEIQNEEKVEFAARPLVFDAEETQTDDDIEEDEK